MFTCGLCTAAPVLWVVSVHGTEVAQPPGRWVTEAGRGLGWPLGSMYCVLFFLSKHFPLVVLTLAMGALCPWFLPFSFALPQWGPLVVW